MKEFSACVGDRSNLQPGVGVLPFHRHRPELIAAAISACDRPAATASHRGTTNGAVREPARNAPHHDHLSETLSALGQTLWPKAPLLPADADADADAARLTQFELTSNC